MARQPHESPRNLPHKLPHKLSSSDDEILLEPLNRLPPDVADVPNDELMSQLAGDAIERMMSNRASGPVEQLTAQIGAFFEELQERHTVAAVVSMEERRELEEELANIPEATPIENPAALLAPVEAKPSVLMRPFDYCGGIVEAMSPRVRLLVSATSVLSFVAGCAALTYVLLLRGA